MSNLPSSQQQFTDKQISAILRRAAELQGERGDAEGGSGASAGISLAQLQQAALERGFDPRLVEEAARELESEDQPGGRPSIWGGPWSVEIERTVAGSVSEEDWPDVLEAIRRTTGLVGKTTRVGKSFEWLGGTDDPVHVTLTPRGEHTRIRIFSRYSSYGAGMYAGAVGLAMPVCLALASTLGWSALADIGLSTGVLAGLFAIARSSFNALCRRKRQRAERVMRALESLVARSAPSRVPVRPAVSEADDTDEQVLRQIRGSAG